MADTQLNIQIRTSGQQKLDRLDRSLQKTTKSSRLLAGALGKLGAAFAGLTVTSKFFQGFAEAGKARAAVRSLGVDVKTLESELRRVSVESGNLASTTQLLAASYDVASAGFGDAADNAKVLEASLQGAVGGMSDIATVSDAVTSVLNAYGLSADKAGKLVDGFIQTQNDGKIIVNQYAQQIGRLAPIAAAAGVSIEEVNAAVSAVTATGVSAEATFAGLRQGIAAILKPTSEAAKLAKELGIAFDAQALKQKGLGGVLQEVIDKTGGSQAAMTKLFGSVEALTALLPLTNDNLETYNDNLDKQKTKTGQAEKATEDLGGTVTTQISRIVNGIGNVARTLDQVLGPALNRILSRINAIIVAANKAILALTDLDVGAANQALAKGATAISFGATSEGVDQLSASLDQLNPATARSTESLERIRSTIFRVQEQLTRIRPEDINASTAVELQGKAQSIIAAVDNRIGELKKLEEKVDEVVKPQPTPDPTPDPSDETTSSGSAVADDAQRQADAIADALKSSQDELAVAAQRLKVSQAATDLLADEERLNLRKLEINQRFDALAKDALSTQQKQNIELTRELELRRASLDAQKGMMDSAQGEFNSFFKQQPEYASMLNDELSETDKLLNGAYSTIANGLQSGIQGLIDGSKELKDVFSDILNQLASMALQFAFKSFGAGIGVPGFDGGGYTGDEPRTGGLDGKGGFLAMLHPQETVIDHYGDSADALTSGTAEQGFADSEEALGMATAAFAEGVAGRNSVSAAFADAGSAMSTATATQLSNVSAQQEALQMAQLQSGASSSTIRYESSVINSISYVTEEQAMKIGMESAKKAEANVYKGLRNMPAVRGRSGVK